MPWVALGMAALSAVSEQKKQDEQRKQAAINARYSPWTGANPGGNQIQSNGALGGAIQGGAAGMAYNQSAKNSDMWQQWMDRHGGPDGQPKNQMPAMNADNMGPFASGNQYGSAIQQNSMPSIGTNNFGPVANGNEYSGLMSGWMGPQQYRG